MRILVVQGDDGAIETVAKGLRRDGHIVGHADLGGQALKTYHCADFVLFDLDIPDVDRLQASDIREVGDAQIIALADRSSEPNQIVSPRATREIVHGELHMDFGKREVHVGGRFIDLTATEFDLLGLLARRPETVFSRKEIMAYIWHAELTNYSRTIDTHIYNLRRKLDANSWIITVRGIGFRLGRGLFGWRSDRINPAS